MKCKVCSAGTYIVPRGKKYGVCDICNSSIILFKPQPHQSAFLADTHIFKNIFGAYGSGKTTTAVIALIEKVLKISNGTFAMLAPTMKMLKKTSYKDFMTFMPHTFIEKEIKTKGEEALILKNGTEILLLPSNNADKIRSLNLAGYYLEEASNAKFDVYAELQARTRSEAAFEFEYDATGQRVQWYDEKTKVWRDKISKNHLMGIACSNPDVGWIRTELLYKSDTVIAADHRKYPRDPEQYNPDMSTHLHSSYQNPYLDPGFQTRIGRGKPDWWVARYIHGSFDYAEGLVYQDFGQAIVDPFQIPMHWKRMFGVDFGLRDPTVMLAAAIDPIENILYIYDEHYEAEQGVSYHAKKMLNLLQVVPPGMIHGQVIADPAGAKRSGVTKRSYFNHYAEYGLWFQPGNNTLEAGIAKVFTYLALGRLKIMSNCIETIKEGRVYKYKESKLDETKNRGETPIDYSNHSMDVIRYIVMELPDDPDKMSSEIYEGNSLVTATENKKFIFPRELQETVYHTAESWYTDY